jgi:hypothetical protein
MTLAVIVGLWGLLLPAMVAGQVSVLRPFAEFHVAAQAPESQGAPTATQPQSQPETGSAAQKPQAQTAATPKPKKHSTKKKTGPNDPPPKVVVRDGSTTEPNSKLSPPMSEKQTSTQIQKADDLLAGTESNLKQISPRALSAAQQETVKQIHTYMDQARKAIDEGDLDRGRNLAFKAHLLSDDLVKH